MNKKGKEIIEIFNRYDSSIKEKLINDIAESYSKLLKDIDSRGIVKRNSFEYPRLNFFLKSVFFYMFKKLHKGNKDEAFLLISELKTQILFIDNIKINYYRLDSIIDDKTYAQSEFDATYRMCDEALKNDIINLIIDYYNKVIKEMNSKDLVNKSGNTQPSIERFIKLAFTYIFEKLHKGDKSKAHAILIDELAKIKDNIEYDND